MPVDVAYENLTPAELYRRFTARPSQAGLPQWPAEDIQRLYVGASGPVLVERAQYFVEMLAEDGAFENDEWHGLDYGCGWGRIASLMRSKGSAQQLDLCDAWERSMSYLDGLGYSNKSWLVSETLTPDDLPDSSYDFVYAFSIFTHLTLPTAANNLMMIYRSLKPGGSLYFTVRHLDWGAYVSTVGRKNVPQQLVDGGYWYEPLPENELFGDLILTPKAVESLASPIGVPRYVGIPEPLQHLYCIEKVTNS